MMKKVLLTTIGCTFVVSITAGFMGFNKGDTGGAPTRPDLAYTHGDPGGGMVSNGSVKDPGGFGSISTEGEADLPTPQA
ncbi:MULTISPECIES: hypothetical protein [unclassified Bacillus (in: firmicutes)]|uniref:hypothetical protein n=1 Tax=unclassified Bacillus (in: firmicutes) TaxID=185979 RepID=UPI0008DF14EE|nr:MULTISPECIES: hypothetical protein [unclassified Bacillus (in: firmicutes)]SFI27478.1 hypothetical protein SAMN04488574_102192 [Bacillus sp. 71mf]SFS39929.1 hypothetical protein SAMN04488145_101274 [Bacillus sp. 103mf]